MTVKHKKRAIKQTDKEKGTKQTEKGRYRLNDQDLSLAEADVTVCSNIIKRAKC